MMAMRKQIGGIKKLFTLILVSGWFVSYSQDTTGLIAHWDMNGEVKDVSGHGHDGTAYNITPATGEDGIAGDAYYFNGKNSYISVPYSPAFNVLGYTISATVKVMGFYTGTCQDNIIILRGKTGVGTGCYALEFQDRSDAYDCTTYDSTQEVFYTAACATGAGLSPADVGEFNYTPHIVKNVWYNVVVTFNDTAYKTYVNGILKATTNITNPGTPMGVSTDGISIGFDLEEALSGFPSPFKGIIDDIKLYGHPWSDSEATASSCIKPVVIISVSGDTTLCAKGSVLLSADTGYSYQWYDSSSAISGATNASYTAKAAGIYSVIATATGGCSDTTAGVHLTAALPANVITPSGPTSFCPYDSVILYADTGAGYSYQWYGGAAGTTIISGATGSSYTANIAAEYSVVITTAAGCSDTSVSLPVSVYSLPDAGSITGALFVLTDSAITLTDTTTGGKWSASNGYATINSGGVVTGVSAGTDTIYYIVTNACGSAAATFVVLVDCGVVTAGTITGTSSICSGSTTALTDTIPGGVWLSSDTTIATISSSGLVTSISGGTATISYAVTNSCGTATATDTVMVSEMVSRIITTVAGDGYGAGKGYGGYSGDDSAATSAKINSPWGIAVDVAGNFYIADNVNNCIRKVSSSGIITTVAGTGTAGFSGDGGAATSAELHSPAGIAIDESGNLYISDNQNMRIRKVDLSGTITTVAGSGTGGFSGDGGAAKSANLGNPWGVAIDDTGNIFIADHNNNRVRKVNTLGIISTYAGTGASGYIGDSVAATSTNLSFPEGVAVDAVGNLYIVSDNRIRKVNTGGIITTVSGVGTSGYSGDGGPATVAKMCNPLDIAIDKSGNIFIPDAGNNCIREVNTLGIITTVAGDGYGAGKGYGGYCGDGGPATAAELNGPEGIAVDALGNLYFGDSYNQRVRKVSASASVVISSIKDTICSGSAITLSGSITGGTWSSSNTKIAAVDSSGHVTGVSAGIDTITYSAIASCGIVSSTITITVQIPVSVITGADTLCAGSVTTLYDSNSGGIWSSSNTKIAIVDSSGHVTGVSAGIDTITYAAKTSCGVASATFAITVRSPVSVITGANTVCAGSVTTLYDSSSGGTWSSSNTKIATISSAGVASGVSTGTAIISYTATTSCGITSVTDTVVVKSTASVIIGADTICTGSVTTLSDSSGAGIWSISNSNATINSAGVVTGVSAGVDTVTYTVTNSCGTTHTTKAISVNSLPDAGSITGASSVIISSAIKLSDTIPGGKWSAGNGYATVDSGGVVMGVSAGTDTISYTITDACGSAAATFVVLVDCGVVTAGTINGTSSICSGSTTALTDTIPGGVWLSSDTTIATVSSSGLVTSISGGTATISYAVTNSCGTATATDTVIVSGLGGGIITTYAGDGISGYSGDGGIATSAELQYPWGIAIDVTGNVYIADHFNNRIRKVNASGIITTVAGTGKAGFSGDGGAATSAELNTPYGLAFDATGNLYISDAGNDRIRKVDLSGTITTVAGGGPGGSFSGDGGPATSATFYTPCGVTVDGAGNIYIADYFNHRVRIVNTLGVISTYAGTGFSGYGSDGVLATSSALHHPSDVAVDAVGNLLIVDHYNNRIRKVNTTGIITTVAGDGTLGYSGDGGPATAAEMRYPDCIKIDKSGNIFISDVDNHVIRKISTSGIITTVVGDGYGAGGSGGYSGDGGPATAAELNGPEGIAIDASGNLYLSDWFNQRVRKVSASAGVVIGATKETICTGAVATLSGSITGGTWSSSNTKIATVDSSGHVTGLGVGNDTISYTVTNSCGTASSSVVITVQSPASVIKGIDSICVGSVTTLSDSGSGGIWSVSNSNATINSAGVVTGVSAGVDTVTYTVTNSCGTTYTTTVIKVNSLPNAGIISGADSVCVLSSVILSSSGDTGSVWSASNGSATVSATSGGTGVVMGVSTGIDTLIYTVTNSCGTANTAMTITVEPLPDAGSIGGADSVCTGSLTLLTDTTGGGTWSSNNTSIATVDGSGNVTGVAGGMAIVSYTVTNSCGTSSATIPVRVQSLVALITGADSVCAGAVTVLTDASGGGTWSTSDATVATVNSLGSVTGVAGGTAIISYLITNWCGSMSATVAVNVQNTVASITGTHFISLCAGAEITLTDTSNWGTWSTSDPTVAMVDGSGNVTGVAAGTAILFYSVTNSCGTSTAAVGIMVENPAGLITGIDSICVGTVTTLSDAISGGAWSTSDVTIATVDGSGNVTGVSAGTATISYTITNSCGTTSATIPVTVQSPAAIITGEDSICVGTVTALSDTSSGGVWSTSDATITPIAMGMDGLENVTGAAAGTATITYTVTNLCGTTSATIPVTVQSPVAAITGEGSICMGTVTALSDTSSGGVWSTSDATVATITTGVGSLVNVTGVGGGTAIITYTLSNWCGTSRATIAITVQSPVAMITGADSVCASAMTTLSDTSSGGTWGTSDATIITVDGLGDVTGVKGGTAIATYTITNSCGTSSATISVKVQNPVAIMTGTDSVCVGAVITLSDTSGGGIWSSSNISVATVDGSGNVTGVSAGIDTITYTVMSSCGTTSATAAIIVQNPASVIKGTDSVCVGAVISLSDAGSGGTWITSNSKIAAVDGSGNVTGVAVGTVIITYTLTNSCGSARATVSIKVQSPSSMITGTDSICVGSVIIFSDSGSGGIWSSSNTSVATVDGSGNVTGVSTGIDTITYTAMSSCGTTSAAVATIVQSTASVITGTDSVCIGAVTSLSDMDSGGTWSTSDAMIATIVPIAIGSGGSGNVTGIAAGTATITYTIVNSCGTSSAIIPVTVQNPAAMITGADSVCADAVTTLSDSNSGGIWISGDAMIATIDGSGNVIGVSSGVDTITYSVSNSCGTTNAIAVVTVNTIPYVAAITGTVSLCSGTITTLSDSVVGGMWSSGDTLVATVNSIGILTGMTTGSVAITYTLSNVCGSGSASAMVSVNTVPAITPVSGINRVCVGSAIILSDSTAGGMWSSNDTSVATVNSGGMVTAMAEGVDTVVYSVSNSCGTAEKTFGLVVNGVPVVSVISGTTILCAGDIAVLSDSTAGGVWSNTTASVATVSATGMATGVSEGVDTITYSVSNSCGISKQAVVLTVNTIPAIGAITGTGSLCSGTTTLLSDTTKGGEWSSSAISVGSVNSSGVVTGVAAGKTTIGYSVSNSCGTSETTAIISVNTAPVIGAISGTTTLCAGTSITLSDSTAGGVWSTDHESVATINAAGVVTGIAGGSDSISYSVSNSCGIAKKSVTIEVNEIPSVSEILGKTTLCRNTMIILVDTTKGGVWSSSDKSVAIVGIGGKVISINSGIDTITYSVSNGCGTAKKMVVITVDTLPAVAAITGMTMLCKGTSIVLYDTTTGGEWSSSTLAIATVSKTGVVTGNAAGNDTITYSVSNSCGTSKNMVVVTVDTMPVVSAIAGITVFKVGTTTTLSDTAKGGTWSSSSSVAAVSSSGVVTGKKPGSATITYLVSNSCGTAEKTVVVNVTPVRLMTDTSFVFHGPIAGDADTSSTAPVIVKIYPNPAQSKVYVLASEKVSVKLLDVNGNVLYEGVSPGQEVWDAMEINMGMYANGIYLVEVYNEQGTNIKTERIVKMSQ